MGRIGLPQLAAMVVAASFANGTIGAESVPDNTVQLPAIVQANPDWDWLQLSSGEWLKGEFISLERDSLNFDSDILGDVTLDWDDIEAVYTQREMAVLFEGGTKMKGTLQVTNNRVYIDGVPLNRSHHAILRIVVGAPREIDLWRGSVSAGLSLRSGNVEELDIDTSARFVRRTAQTTFRSSYIANYTETDNVESANDHRANASFDLRLSRRWYLQPLRAEYYRDKIQNIDTQWQIGFGANYYAIETASTLWTIAAGPGYQRTLYFEVPPGRDRQTSSGTFLVSTEYDQELTSTVDIYGAYRLTYADDDSGGITQHVTLALDVDLIGDLDLRVATYIDRIESPQANADGVRPDKTDSRLTVGLSYDL